VDVLHRDDLERLASATPGPCVSIYLPTHRAGAEIEQDPIRLKNLLDGAEEQLRSLGVRSKGEMGEPLGRARTLVDERSFWRYQADGLAIFLRPGEFRALRLPVRFDELVNVADRFHVKPLLPYFASDGRFFVLALSQNQVRLLEGSRHAVDDVELGDAPESLAEAMHYDDPERELLLHVSGGGPGGRAIFHGHGAGDEVDKERLGRFFRDVDRGLLEILRGDRVPIVLAGVEYATAIYRDVSSYPELEHEVVAGNPDRLSAEELHERAWAIVEPRFRATLEADLARFRELDGTGLTARELVEVIAAAGAGRAEAVFAARDEERWGSVSDGDVRVHDQRELGDEDLIDAAVVAGLRTGARIHVLPAGEMPAAPTAAILRY
jgi:hypothetical protein